MKAVIRVYNINSAQDINNVKNAITSNEGIIACQISKKKGQVEVIYDDFFIDLNKILDSIEDIGYTII